MKIKDIELFPDEVMTLIDSQEFIGIRLSGGSDSALLCHIVLKYFPHIELLPIIMFNRLRPAAEQSVKNVLNALNALNPNNKLMTPEIGYFDTTGWPSYIDGVKQKNPKMIFQPEFIRSVFAKYDTKLNFILSGETLNPPIEDQIVLGVEQRFVKNRNLKRINLCHEYDVNGVTKWEYSPFRNSNKREVAEIYKELNLMESLFPLTETCETEPHVYEIFGVDNNITYTAPGIEPCQCCWPCREKYWAYGVFDFNTKNRTTRLK